MKSLLILVALAAGVLGDVSHLGYDYHAPEPVAQQFSAPQTNYLPPVVVKSETLPLTMYLPPEPAVVAPKKTYIPPQPMPSNNYLPPVVAPKKTYIPPVPVLPPKPVAPSTSYLPPTPQEVPSNNYLPPTEEIAPKRHIITPPAPRLEDLVPPQPPQRHYEDSEILTENGYQTVRKLKL